MIACIFDAIVSVTYCTQRNSDFATGHSQAAAETTAQTAREELASSKAEAADLALQQQHQVQQLQQDLDLAHYNLQQAEQQSEAAVRKQQRRTQASSQQIARLEQELAEVVKEAELHNQRRVQAEDKAAALQLELDSAPATSSDDSILLQNLRDELAAQSADIATARRLKDKIRYWLHSRCQAVHTCQSIAEDSKPTARLDGMPLDTVPCVGGPGCTSCPGSVAGSR